MQKTNFFKQSSFGHSSAPVKLLNPFEKQNQIHSIDAANFGVNWKCFYENLRLKIKTPVSESLETLYTTLKLCVTRSVSIYLALHQQYIGEREREFIREQNIISSIWKSCKMHPHPRRVLKPHFTCRWCIMRGQLIINHKKSKEN